MRYLFILIFGLLPTLVSAVVFDDSTRRLPLGHHMAVWEDPGRGDTISDVLVLDAAGRFTDHRDDVLNAGYSRSAFWLRIDLQYRANHSHERNRWWLELAYPPLDRLDIYLPDGQGGYYIAGQSGDSLPFSQRQIKQRNHLFELELAPDRPQRIYLRVESEGSIQVPLTLWAPVGYLEEQSAHIYVLAIIYGVLLVMLVYNLFIYLSVRDRSYLYYILYIGSFGLYQVSVNGLGVQYLWPDSSWWANASTPFLIGAAALFGSQFARSFLHTREHSLWIDRTLITLMAFGGLTMVLALTSSYSLALRLATLLALCFIVVILIAGGVAWYRGMRVARYFLIAWTAFLVGGLINTLMVLGYLPHTFITMYAGQIGSALEVALLSLALADRINAMREERAVILEETGRKLEEMNRELAESNRLKDQFLANVTHELRTPMHGVLGGLDLMRTLELTGELEQYQRIAAGSAREMMRLVNDILALTELQAGKLQVRNEPFGLRAMVDELHVLYGARAAVRGVGFKLELANGLPDRLVGDPVKLKQCLGYLLDNAIKFTLQGRVTLALAGHDEADSRFMLEVDVTDTGVGFEAPADDTLFHHFRQLDGSMTRQYGGLGIGLSLCRQLVELQGGEISYRSEPGRGSRFKVRLSLRLP
ncbi:sensor histidine kinase [Pseudomonas sp. SST3]|uniref:sensor histidine kinase n=1 Tax=Pseudomonas sp. SST3 TaxID=2267882 RepID=UPI000E00E7E8|nr:hybrid sensor histidine kinase/response regulator [Pseudomonas sp. SST3]NKQ11134.1 hybrid sensor histidine kinase/response regulator [Pseudomonas sp. SST3]